ncbi:hypothetical protein [Luteococcus sanguinis]|uniref:Cellulose synthase n=1 Tax=Luteococcus sanguinis TaxID=174038 RepID=A0ABW1WXL2_9ACTN
MPTSMENLVLIGTATLTVLVLIWTFIRFQTGGGARTLLRGVGAVLALVGLYLSGLALLAGNGIRSVYDWAHRTSLSTTMTVGFSLIGVGLLFFLIGSLLKTRSKQDRASVRAAKKNKRSVEPARTTGSTSLSSEDREVEALLDKRGIN